MSKKRIVRNIFVLLLGAISILPASALAQCPVSVAVGDGGAPRIKTEFAIGVGGVYTMLEAPSTDVALKPRLGYQGYVQMALVFGRFIGVGTEICYSGGSVIALRKDKKFERTVRTTTVDIPIFLTLRLLNIVRLNLGPQFTVMSRAEYSDDGNTKFFGPVYPTVNATAGLGVKLFSNLMLEARYIYPLGRGTNQFDDREFTTTTQRITAGLTLTF
jgi:hypothetical protein